MGFIGEIIGYPLGWIMWAIYQVFHNYGIAIVIFTIITRALLTPLSAKQEKSSARMMAFQPKLKALEKKYGKNKEKMQEEQMKLYSEEGINPMGSCLPLLIQFPILFGIIDVVYRPLTHILRFGSDIIEKASKIALDFFTQISKTGTDQTAISAADAAIKNFQSRPELYIFQAFNDKPELFAAIPNFAEKMDSFDPIIFGGMFNLCDLPTWTFPALLIPIFAGLTQLAYTVYMQWYQKKQNPDAPSMGAMNLVMYLMPLMSIWMAFAFPMGVGFYWIIQSIVAFGQTVLLKKYYSKDRLEKILAKDRAKQKKKKPSFMQRALEEQKRMMAENGGQMPVSARDAVSKDVDVEKLSKSGKKELDRKIIAEARRRQAEKYGEEYVDTDDEKE